MKTKTTAIEDLSQDELVASYKQFDSIIRNNGWDPKNEKFVKMEDALQVQNASFMIPRVMTQIIQEGIEPLLIGTSLLEHIQYVPGMQTIFPAVEPLNAAEVADDGGLPIYNINVGGAQTYGMTVTRHGLMLKIAKKFVAESAYPWLNMWLRMASAALARHKEEYIFDFITRLGTVIFDNSTAARLSTNTVGQPQKGFTTGRNIKGQFNGSMTVDDIFDMYAELLMQGFIPDTLLVHPMAWLMWVKDPTLREFAMQAGGGTFFANWTGNPAQQGNSFWNNGGLGLGVGQTGTYQNGVLTGGQSSTQVGLPQRQNSAFQLPNYLGLPFRILVSPFMRFDPVNRVCDVLMFNSRNLGALIVEAEPHVTSFDDIRYSIQEMAIEESYGFGILNEGLAIGVARNVKIRPNEIAGSARPVLDINGATSLYEIQDQVQDFGNVPLDVNSR